MFIILFAASFSYTFQALQAMANRTIPKVLYFETSENFEFVREENDTLVNPKMVYSIGNRSATIVMRVNESTNEIDVAWAYADSTDGWKYRHEPDPQSEKTAEKYLSNMVNCIETPTLKRSLSERVKKSDEGEDHQLVVILNIMGKDTVQAIGYRVFDNKKDTFVEHHVVVHEDEEF